MQFLKSSSPRELFVSVLTQKIENTPESPTILGQNCEQGHGFISCVPTIAAKFFNCLSQNFASKINDDVHASRKRAPKVVSESSRKIAKLQSE